MFRTRFFQCNLYLILLFQSIGIATASNATTQLTIAPTAHVLQDLLIAEIASKHQKYTLANEALINAFQQTQKTRLLRQAWQTAVISGNMELAYRTATLWVEKEPHSKDSAILAAYNIILLKNIELQNKSIVATYLEKIYQNHSQPTLWLESLIRHIYQNATPEQIKFITPLLHPYLEKHKTEPLLALGIASFDKTQGKFRQACQKAVSVFNQHSSDEKITRTAADICWPQKPQKAIHMLQKHLQKTPNSAQVRLVYARALLQNNDTKEALRQVEIALTDTNNDNSTLFDAAMILFNAQKWESAQKYFSQLLQGTTPSPMRDIILIKLAKCARGMQHWKQAEQYYAQVQHEPQKLQSALFNAQNYIRQGLLSQGAILYQELKKKYPRQQQIITQDEIAILDQYHHYKRSLTLLQQNYTSDITDQTYLLNLATHAVLAHEEKFARQVLLQLLGVNPEHTMALNTLGYIFAEKGKHLLEAQALLEEAYRIDPLNSYILDSIGWLYFQKKDYAKALPFLLLSLEIQYDEECVLHIVETLYHLNRKSEAQDLLQQLQEKTRNKEKILNFQKRLFD